MKYFFRKWVYILFPPVLCCSHNAPVTDIPGNPVIPSEKQLAYQHMEVIGFVHFGVNTFTDREWGTGEEDEAIFNPVKLDAEQWVKAAKDAGMGMLILTAKHHDGFCLWPSEYTEHSVKNSLWKAGKGDVVEELSDACQKFGLKFGIYLSPWDMHEPKYGTSEYNDYYLSQLRELLTNYGTVSEVWMDGAKGKNAKDMEYDFPAYRSLVYKLQPQALIFSDVGPDVRWIGNENGIAGKTNWSMISTEGMQIGKADTGYLNTGDPAGDHWIPGECDVSIRPGWFYHAEQDDQVKLPQQLVDLYYKSVGRNGTLLLNIPPAPDGLFNENDVASLIEFRSIIDETFSRDIALNARVRSSSEYAGNGRFSAGNMTDGNPQSYWAADSLDNEPVVIVNLNENYRFDRIMLQEPVRLGQRMCHFSVETFSNGSWLEIATGTTVGYKRILRIDPVTSDKIRLKIDRFNNLPAISHIGLYKASERE